jgi:Arc/MetJ-type ribon-helix-helix transcriptional regulator
VPESEKVTINLGYVDLGRIDLLVREGFFSNRTDFIRTAIRNQLNRQSAEVSRSIDRHTLEVGLLELGVAELEAARAAAKCFTSRSSDWSALPRTSRRNWRCRRSAP